MEPQIGVDFPLMWMKLGNSILAYEIVLYSFMVIETCIAIVKLLVYECKTIVTYNDYQFAADTGQINLFGTSPSYTRSCVNMLGLYKSGFGVFMLRTFFF